MYTLNEYGHMLADTRRTRAYVAALQKVVQPGMVVVEIGTGVGLFALVAARLGASRVYAFEPSSSICIAERVLKANGYAEIQLIRARSTQVALTERADVVFSDLRGSIPVFADHFASIVDARTRFLRSGGALVPLKDRLWVALVEGHPLYERTVNVWRTIGMDVNVEPAYDAQASTPIKCRLSATDLLSNEAWWHTFDYQTVELRSFSNNVALVARRDGTCHGIALWFDTELWDGIGYASHPAQPPMIYGQMFFPWPRPVSLRAGDRVSCTISADLRNGMYIWRWTSATPTVVFEQSTENLPDVIDAVSGKPDETGVPDVSAGAKR